MIELIMKDHGKLIKENSCIKNVKEYELADF